MPRGSSESSSNPRQTFLRLRWADRFLLLEAALWLAVARAAVVFLPFRVISRRLGEHMAESATGETPSTRDLIRRVKWSITAISRRAPWRCLCLERSIAAKMMLRARRVSNTLYLGVTRNRERGRLDAHAWLRSGPHAVTGGDGRGHYAIVSTFADRGGRYA